MVLSWWPVAVIGLLGLAAVVAAAWLLPLERQHPQPVLLANTRRLTRLPEYIRVARVRSLAVIIALALLVLVFGAAVLAAARPAQPTGAGSGSDGPDDLMLCVAAPLTQRVTGAFFGFFAEHPTGDGGQRIGLTSPNRRVIPLTRDHQFAAARFGELATTGDPAGDASAAAGFAPAVTYTDYAATVDDQLALCLTGFPSADESGPRRRSLIYLGPPTLGDPADDRPALFTDQQVTELAADAGVQVNAIAIGGREDPLGGVVDATGGQYLSVPPDADAATVAAHLDAILAAPPAVPHRGAGAGTGDHPVTPLIAAVLGAMLLALALVGVRR